MEKKLSPAIFVGILIVLQIIYPTLTVHAAGNCLASSIVGSAISPEPSTSVSVPTSGLTYIYAATIGGSFTITPVDFQQDLGVTNAETYQSVIIGHSSSNISSFQKNGALYPTIGGIGVACSTYHTQTFQNSNQTRLTGSFTLQSESLAILASAASNTLAPSPTLTGPFAVDSSSSNGQGGQIIFAHADLSSGSYTFTVQYTPWNDPGQRVIGAVLYIFSASNASNTVFGFDPTIFYGSVGGIVALIAILGGVFALRRKR